MTASQHRAEREDQAHGYGWEALTAPDISTMELSRLAYITKDSHLHKLQWWAVTGQPEYWITKL